MAKNLKEYFPMIRTRKEVLEGIGKSEKLLAVFESWTEEEQEEFLDLCSGARGAKILRDSFFKEILSPEYHKDRLERFVSLVLEKEVRIKQILPNDSVRIADEYSLLITDIIMEAEDGSLVNVEIQKIGYAFPGERMACYSADMLLRQYKRVRMKRKKKFTYRDMKDVFLIVLLEKSTPEFHTLSCEARQPQACITGCPDGYTLSSEARQSQASITGYPEYIHRGEMRFDTGLQLNTLQKYVLVPLDIYKENKQNEDIKDELDAWLAFLSFDEPERIMELIEEYPQFRAMYEEIYRICSNIEGVMNMFSKELREIDRNTVKYMIEEQEKELEEKNKEIRKNKKIIAEKDAQIEELKKRLIEALGENK